MNRARTRSAIVESARRLAPATLRNREPIAEVLGEWLPSKGVVLEIASGSGEHAVFFARRFPTLQWQPSDQDEEAVASIEAWRREAPAPNLLAARQLDASESSWPVEAADAVLCINMAHISPWAATLGVLDRAAQILAKDAPLIFYGPWLADDIPTAASNCEFNAQLRSRDPEWGIRRVEDLVAACEPREFRLIERRAMPANNMMLLLRRVTDPR